MAQDQKTGTDNVTYNLISVVYHALQAAETTEQYRRDAEQSGDEEVVRYFKDVQDHDRRRADEGKRLLARLLQR
jgi:hypothetical protein